MAVQGQRLRRSVVEILTWEKQHRETSAARRRDLIHTAGLYSYQDDFLDQDEYPENEWENVRIARRPQKLETPSTCQIASYKETFNTHLGLTTTRNFEALRLSNKILAIIMAMRAVLTTPMTTFNVLTAFS